MKENKVEKQLSIMQMLVDTNTDDSTVSQFLEEEHSLTYKPLYRKAFIEKHSLVKKNNVQVPKSYLDLL